MRRSEIDAIPLEGDVSFRERAIEPERGALLVVDLQKGEYNPEKRAKEPEHRYLFDRIRDMVIPNGQRLIAACRSAGMEIVYTVVECLTRDGRDRSLDYKVSGIFAARGSREAEVIDELRPGDDDIVIPKTASSVFNSTNIEYVLRNLGVEYVAVMGILTDQCVESAVRDGCDRGFLMTLVDDASATHSIERHREALRGFGGYCRIRTTHELVRELAAVSGDGDEPPPPREIVTDVDRAQARFEAGDAVRFATGVGSWKTGAIEKLNPKRARVWCEDGVWDVPYRLLDHLDESSGNGNEARLVEVARQARALMDEHGLHEWTFRFSAARGRLGECRERERFIRLSRRHAVNGDPREVRDTILHEIAHALAGARARHGPAWKAIARRLGATPKARAEEGEDARAGREAAKARFRAGMEVSFRTRGGQLRTGVIVRMNPKRARVDCGAAAYLVPYPALEPAPSASEGGSGTPG